MARGCENKNQRDFFDMGDTLLEHIDSLEDYRRVSDADLPRLANEIRAYMIDVVSKRGGHLSASLGAVELIMAIHRVFDSPTDKIVFDVGHQAYAHKILTGRRAAFESLRAEDGISGFPKRDESEHDRFDTGHATTSVSAALGMARAMKLAHEDGVAVAVIGDGALTGGMAYEAINDAGQADVPLVIILNDNEMSISQNVGAMHKALINMRVSRSYVRLKRFVVRALDTGVIGRWLSGHMETLKNRIKSFLLPHMPFEEMGFLYLGPIDGHDIKALVRILSRAKAMRVPVIVHCVTQKGRGYVYSERNPEKFHGTAPFSVDTGEVEHLVKKSNSAVFGDALTRLAEADEKIVAVTAAMPLGTGLTDFAERFPDRFFDVGIAEQHAVTMAAGLAAGGMKPVVAIYSTFLQRAYDQVLHDVCLQRLPVVFAIDRAGLVGEDGETHQGIYDLAYLSAVPNLTIYSPATQQELVHMLHLALESGEPAAIRYNRGSLMQCVSSVPVEKGVWVEEAPISACTVIATGDMVALALPVARACGAGLINARTVRPLDESMLLRVKQAAKRVIVMEDGIDCLGLTVTAALSPVPVTRLCVPNEPIVQATQARQREKCGLTAERLEKEIKRRA